MEVMYLPTLAPGGHGESSGHACVMEYVSVLAGETWSDEPSCTHPWIAALARSLNDSFYDGRRNQLVPLIPRLMQANYPAHFTAAQRAAGNRRLSEFTKRHTDGKFFTFLASIGIHTPADKFTTGTIVAVATQGSDIDSLEFLTGMLDLMDDITGRSPAEPIPQDRMNKAVARVEHLPLVPQVVAKENKPTFVAKVKSAMDNVHLSYFAFGQAAVAPIMAVKPVVETTYTVTADDDEFASLLAVVAKANTKV